MKTLTNPKQSTAKSWALDPRFPAVLFLSNHVAKKRCKACGVEKPLSEFHKAKANKDGPHHFYAQPETNKQSCSATRQSVRRFPGSVSFLIAFPCSGVAPYLHETGQQMIRLNLLLALFGLALVIGQGQGLVG